MPKFALVRNPALAAALAALICCLVPALLASRADAALQIESAGAEMNNPDGSFLRQAGGHPDFTFSTSVISTNGPVEGFETPGPEEPLHDLEAELPPGLVGNPTALPECLPKDLAYNPAAFGSPNCPVDTQVGVAKITYATTTSIGSALTPLFNLAHGPNVPAAFGFNYLGTIAVITARVRPLDGGGYAISSGSYAISQALSLLSARVTLWGVPAASVHDKLRAPRGTGGITEGQEAASSVPKVPFFSLPTSCPEEPSTIGVRADGWGSAGIFDELTLDADEEGTPFVFENCDELGFEPTLSAQPKSRAADTPTGLVVDLDVPQNQDPEGLATAHVKSVEMTLPEGMSVSTASASGLAGCSIGQIGLNTVDAPTCPDAAKLGAVSIKTPLLKDELEGSVYLATPFANPSSSLIALYIAVKGPGFWVKLPGAVSLNPASGRLTASFDNTPQLPFEHLHLELKEGPRAALATPSACGEYTTTTRFTSWAGQTVSSDSSFQVEGCANAGKFNPTSSSGTVNPTAGSYSPLVWRVTREDGEENLAGLEETLPKGLLAKLAGVALCPDAQAASGDCPSASQIGRVTVATGAGPNPLFVPEAGKAPTGAYLAGPYKGAPYSVVVKVPAQAGPFDLGTVAVRNALYVDPETTQVTAKSDPLPQILQGIPISYREVRVEITRPDFTLNPTNCSQLGVTSVLTSVSGKTASQKTPFAAANCERLAFGPSLALQLKGQTKRTGNPALTATLKAPKGQANLARTTVILPKAAFIDQRHVNNPCTRAQFAAAACPAKSILGSAKAWSPLLDKPLSGPVYFRANGGVRELPDIVADLGGQIHVTLVGFIDSKRVGAETALIRTRFASIPDAPVSKFVLKMKGGKRGLIQNSTNLCRAQPKAEVKMVGQNGKTHDFEQKIAVPCSGGGGKKRK